jgi:hypothetical protein
MWRPTKDAELTSALPFLFFYADWITTCVPRWTKTAPESGGRGGGAVGVGVGEGMQHSMQQGRANIPLMDYV